MAEQFYSGTRQVEGTTPGDITRLPDLDIPGLRADESVARALEMVILTMSQQLSLLADQRDKGVALRELLRSSAD